MGFCKKFIVISNVLPKPKLSQLLHDILKVKFL